jgi:hypothetical protein
MFDVAFIVLGKLVSISAEKSRVAERGRRGR